MSSRTITRRILAYAVHGHTKEAILEYPDFFQMLMTLALENRRMVQGDQVTAIASIEKKDDEIYLLRVVTGNRGTAPMLFDLETGAERIGQINESEIVAASIVLAVNTKSRAVAIERRRPGVPLAVLEKLLSSLGRDNNFEKLIITFTPVSKKSFLEEIETFERIRRAEVQLARPNYDWTDNASALVGELGHESGADRVEVAAVASRGQSLNKESGIVQDIKNFASRPINALKNVKIFGRKTGGLTESTLSLESHQVQEQVEIPRSFTEEESDQELMGKAHSLVSVLELPSDEKFTD